MKLLTWLRINRVSYAEFARRAGLPRPQYAWKYATGLAIPSVTNMASIHRATDGQVTANDFYGLEESGPQPVLPGDAASPEIQEVAE